MIYYIDNTRLSDLRTLICEKNIYACKIACLLESYGLKYDFAEFWVQYVCEKPVTAVSKFYGDMTVYATAQTDFDELKEFLEITGFSSVLCEREIFPDSYSGIIMEKVFESENPKAEINPDLNEVYRLLESCKSDNFEVPSYEDFRLRLIKITGIQAMEVNASMHFVICSTAGKFSSCVMKAKMNVFTNQWDLRIKESFISKGERKYDTVL